MARRMDLGDRLQETVVDVEEGGWGRRKSITDKQTGDAEAKAQILARSFLNIIIHGPRTACARDIELNAEARFYL